MDQRRASDHPWEMAVRLIVGVLFASAAVWFGSRDQHTAMSAAYVATGMMFKVNIGAVLNKIPVTKR